MNSDLSPENEQFIRQAVECGTFQSRAEALDEAVELLKGRQQLLRHIDEGTRQLRAGEGTELNGEKELRAFFDEIRVEAIKRDAMKNDA